MWCWCICVLRARLPLDFVWTLKWGARDNRWWNTHKTCTRMHAAILGTGRRDCEIFAIETNLSRTSDDYNTMRILRIIFSVLPMRDLRMPPIVKSVFRVSFVLFVLFVSTLVYFTMSVNRLQIPCVCACVSRALAFCIVCRYSLRRLPHVIRSEPFNISICSRHVSNVVQLSVERYTILYKHSCGICWHHCDSAATFSFCSTKIYFVYWLAHSCRSIPVNNWHSLLLPTRKFNDSNRKKRTKERKRKGRELSRIDFIGRSAVDAEIFMFLSNYDEIMRSTSTALMRRYTLDCVTNGSDKDIAI